MPDVIAEAWVATRPLIDNYESELIDQLGPPAERAGKDAGEKAGAGFNQNLVKNLSKAGAVVAGVAGLIAKSWNSGVNEIRKETGLTGDALDDLVDSARDVSKSGITTGFDEVASTIAALKQRTELAGPALEALTRQIVQLSELTGGDASDSVEGIVDLFKVWQVETADQAGLLDLLYTASQKSGASIDTLIGSLASGVGPLTNFGFTLEEAIAFIAQVEREGGNAPKVINALQIAFVKLSQSTDDPEKALDRLSKRIRDAKTSAEATRIAVEAFGSRAGPILAGAIRKGRLSVEEFLNVLQGSTETIAKAREETTTLGDRFTMLRQSITASIGPFAQHAAVLATVVTGIAPALVGIRALTAAYQGLAIYAGLANTSILALAGVALAPLAAGAALATAALLPTIAALNQFNKTQEEHAKSMEAGRGLVAAWGEQLRKGMLTVDEFKAKAENLAEAEGVQSDAMGEAARVLNVYGDRLRDTGDKTDKVADKTEEAGRVIKRFAGMTRKELQEWRDSAEGSLQDISGAFAALGDDIDVTADDLIQAQKSQVRALRDFKDNLNVLITRGAKPAFIKDLVDMGAQGAVWADALASDTKKTGNEFTSVRHRVAVALDALTGSVAKADKNVKTHGQGIRDGIKGIGGAADESKGKVEGLKVSIAELLALRDAIHSVDYSSSPSGNSGGGGGGGTKGTSQGVKNEDYRQQVSVTQVNVNGKLLVEAMAPTEAETVVNFPGMA